MLALFHQGVIRLMKMVVMVIFIAVGAFILVHSAPGDPATVIAGQSGAADAETMALLRERFGLDKPFHMQLLIYLGQVLTFDLGFSYRLNQPVPALILERLPATLLLTGAAFVMALTVGILLGALSGRKPGGWVDRAISVLLLFFYATPIFWVGLVLILVFSVWLGWLPAFGMGRIDGSLTGLDLIADRTRHLLLPAVTLGMFFAAVYARLTRSSVIGCYHQDYVRTAKAKGVRESRVLFRHVLRNAILPVVTFAGLQAGQLVGGTVLVETVFAWPGIGRLAFDSLMARDHGVLLGIFVCTAVIVMVVNLLTDLVSVLVDPRVRAS